MLNTPARTHTTPVVVVVLVVVVAVVVVVVVVATGAPTARLPFWCVKTKCFGKQIV